MPELDFKVTGIEPGQRGVAPLLHFLLEVSNSPDTETIQSIMLQAQIQIQATQRAYTAAEKEKLKELFGKPEDWGQTLRTRLFAHANAIVPQFTARTKTILAVPCTFDFQVAATKYFYALEEGEVPLLFLFSGTVFYVTPDGRLQIQKISWDKECVYRMPVQLWREMMDHHYPDSSWIALRRDLFDRLYELRRREGLATWDEAVEHLLDGKSEIRNKPEAMSNGENEGDDVEEDAFWGESAVVREEPGGRKYDLEERTARFGEATISFAKDIPRNAITDRLITQLVGCATSIGANYCEADDAVSRKEFFLRAGTCRKEAREAKHFLRMVAMACPELKDKARPLWQEAKELNLIFGAIYQKK